MFAIILNSMTSPHPEEIHRSHRAAWLRAAVLGVNDGIVSTSSIMLGVLAANASDATILTAGISSLVAGALSMAVGEYVSVSSQKDSEKEDIAIERRSIENNHDAELSELAAIYETRGLKPKLALEVATQLHEHDAVGAHVRDELGIDHENLANPVQAALASATAFSFGAIIPILAAVFSSSSESAKVIVIVSLFMLGVSGAIGAFIGGGHKLRAAARVFVGGGIAMALTAVVGHFAGTQL